MKIPENSIPLKFGIVCTGTRFRAWEAQCIQGLLSTGNVELSFLIIEEKPETGSHDDARVFWGIPDLFSLSRDPFVKTKNDTSVDLTELLKTTDRIFCNGIRKQGKFLLCLQDRDLKKVASCPLDFILSFGVGTITGEILHIPRYGVWSFHWGDEKNYCGEPSCFWEVYHNDPVTGATLQRLTDKPDEGIVLKKGFYKTNPISYSATRDALCKEAARWPVYVVRDIRNKNAPYLEAPPRKNPASLNKEPSQLHMLVFFCKIGIRKLFFSVNDTFRRVQWNVGVINEPIDTLLENTGPLPVSWYPLKKSDDFFLADPFGQMIDKTLYIFCEKFGGTSRLGELMRVTMKNGIYSPPEHVVTDLTCHLSYPYLLNYGGETYLIPESRQERSILLYKAENFPEKWNKVNIIARDINASDSTVFFFNDMWYLMYTDQDIGENSSLCILYSESLFGPWKPHPGNPVKEDVRSARPAGTPFMKDTILYRPSQDCSGTYGGRIMINKITMLTPTQFSEETVAVIRPSYPYPEGTHTLSSVGNYTLIDGCRSVFRGSTRFR